MDVIALLAPGQGSQAPGMLTPWLDVPGARDDLAVWSAACSLDLLHLGTEADADTIRDTAVAQPLLTAAALLSTRVLEERPGVVCGHSIGEVAALAVAGVIPEATAVLLAAERGRAMAAAAAVAPTGMAALLGADADVVAGLVDLELATVNVAGQVVVGGPVAALDALVASPPEDVRVRRLETAGAFHTSAMAPAVGHFADLVSSLDAQDPVCPVVANADGAVLTSGRALLDRLVGQLTGPVRFDLCLSALQDLGVTRVVELAPAGTLTAIAKRALSGVELVALKAPVMV